jgi:hypothetical protein
LARLDEQDEKQVALRDKNNLKKEIAKWKSREQARSHPVKDRQTGLPAQSGSIRFFKRPILHLFKAPA